MEIWFSCVQTAVEVMGLCIAKAQEILPGNTNWKGRLSTDDLLNKAACFVKKGKWYIKYKKELI
jgi:hypothetical protein